MSLILVGVGLILMCLLCLVIFIWLFLCKLRCL